MPSDETRKIEFYQDSDAQRLISLPNQESDDYRSPYRRDYARLLHSPTFRRLKGKTQLFPGIESDFYRNRLTHSLEVAQIGKSIAIYLNWQLKNLYTKDESLKGNLVETNAFIDLDLVEFACLAHDIGHPPFGHQGEEALDEQMKGHGGFEGNAQTLRLLARLEKKDFSEPLENDPLHHIVFKGRIDQRVGLNLTFRTLASVIKYDNVILSDDRRRGTLSKGYYETEKKLVASIKQAILKGVKLKKGEQFKTVECQIMDIADDIAYSVYDLEDAFKGGFFHPLELYSRAHDDKDLLEKIATKIKTKGSKEDNKFFEDVKIEQIQGIIKAIFFDNIHLGGEPKIDDSAKTIRDLHKMSVAIAKDGYFRTKFTSKLAGKFIESVEILPSLENPAFSKVHISDVQVALEIEVLKHLTYEYQIVSPKLKAVEFKGKRIITEIFAKLSDSEYGAEYLPEDVRRIYNQAMGDQNKNRVICDFIASMTDSYAIEFYSRLFSSSTISIHRPYN